MPDKKAVTVILIPAIILAGITGYWIFSHVGQEEEKPSISMDINKFSYLRLWRITLDQTNVENSSANLKSALITVNETGRIDQLSFYFWATGKDGERRRYQGLAAERSLGALHFSPPFELKPDIGRERKKTNETVHPYTFFRELDRAGLLRENIALSANLFKGFGGETENSSLEYYALNRTGGANPITRIVIREWVTPVSVDPFTSGPEVESMYFLWYDVQRASSVVYET